MLTSSMILAVLENPGIKITAVQMRKKLLFPKSQILLMVSNIFWKHPHPRPLDEKMIESLMSTRDNSMESV